MTVYLLHITPAFKHARHYIGYTPHACALRRVEEHKQGKYKASPLIKAALAAGCRIKLAQVWLGADQNFERKLKNRKDTRSWCPCCGWKAKRIPIYQPKENNDENETT